MNVKKLTDKQKEEIVDAVQINGIEYYFTHEVDETDFEGTELEKPVSQFRAAYQKIVNILELELTEEDDEDDDNDDYDDENDTELDDEENEDEE